jgi:hypothetical protein
VDTHDKDALVALTRKVEKLEQKLLVLTKQVFDLETARARGNRRGPTLTGALPR